MLTRSLRHKKAFPCQSLCTVESPSSFFCFLFLFLFVFLADRLRRRRRRRCYHYDDTRHDDKDVGRTAPLHRNNKRQKNVWRRRKRSEKRLRLPLHTVDLSHWYACRIPNSGIQGLYAASYSTHTVFRFPTSQVARIWKKPKGTEDSLSRRELTRGAVLHTAQCVSACYKRVSSLAF